MKNTSMTLSSVASALTTFPLDRYEISDNPTRSLLVSDFCHVQRFQSYKEYLAFARTAQQLDRAWKKLFPINPRTSARIGPAIATQGCPDFFGIQAMKSIPITRSRVDILTYADAKALLAPLGLTTARSHRAWWEKQRDSGEVMSVPAVPADYYARRHSWVSWDDYLSVS